MQQTRDRMEGYKGTLPVDAVAGGEGKEGQKS